MGIYPKYSRLMSRIGISGFAFLIMLFGAAISQASNEHGHGASVMGSILENYLKIQDSLASDLTQGVGEMARAISVEAPKAGAYLKDFSVKLKKAALTLSSEKEIKPTRERFKELSSLMVKWAKVQKPEGIQVVFCSMANASWLQKNGTVKNPYYGKGMLECGEIEK